LIQEKRTRKFRWDILLAVTLAAVLLALIGTVVTLYWLPYHRARSEMPRDGVLTIQEKSNGHLMLSWPEAEKRDFYHVEVLRRQQVEGEEAPQWKPVFSTYVSRGTSCPLPELPGDELLTIRVNSMMNYQHPGKNKIRPGDEPLEVQLRLAVPVVEDLRWTADPDADTLTLTFSMTQGDKGRLFLREAGEDSIVRTLETGETVVSFGENGDFPVPEHGKEITFVLDSVREEGDYVFISRRTQEVTVTREDFLGRNLIVQMEETSDNIYTLTWNETKGEAYQVQMMTPEGWQSICSVAQGETLSCTTGQLKAFRDYSFRVVATGGQVTGNGQFAAVSQPWQIRTDEALLYATIWPLMDLEVFDSPDRTNAIGTVKAGSTYCVTGVDGSSFAIRFAAGDTGYIDSNYCLIDLAEYLGELCAYDITNSYASKYKAHKYNIPYMTGTVITGYEDVLLEDGTYLVPLLYPVANRLMTAAKSARAEGYRLKIYDAYRPNQATVSLYSRVEKLQDEPVPGNVKDPDNEEELLTYAKVMTNSGQYPLNYFLAKGYSKHNLGVAIDLTIEDLETGEEYSMQTPMHDLSHYSVIYRNNKHAQALNRIMKDAGFGGLVSEWWHFQDNEVREKQKLSPLWGGVSPEGWKLSADGWRWRNADGSYAVGRTLTLEEGEYSFDERGCLIES